jgi:hypothetical protein
VSENVCGTGVVGAARAMPVARARQAAVPKRRQRDESGNLIGDCMGDCIGNLAEIGSGFTMLSYPLPWPGCCWVDSLLPSPYKKKR